VSSKTVQKSPVRKKQLTARGDFNLWLLFNKKAMKEPLLRGLFGAGLFGCFLARRLMDCLFFK